MGIGGCCGRIIFEGADGAFWVWVLGGWYTSMSTCNVQGVARFPPPNPNPKRPIYTPNTPPARQDTMRHPATPGGHAHMLCSTLNLWSMSTRRYTPAGSWAVKGRGGGGHPTSASPAAMCLLRLVATTVACTPLSLLETPSRSSFATDSRGSDVV